MKNNCKHITEEVKTIIRRESYSSKYPAFEKLPIRLVPYKNHAVITTSRFQSFSWRKSKEIDYQLYNSIKGFVNTTDQMARKYAITETSGDSHYLYFTTNFILCIISYTLYSINFPDCNKNKTGKAVFLSKFWFKDSSSFDKHLVCKSLRVRVL